jgi:hypothetical protein
VTSVCSWGVHGAEVSRQTISTINDKVMDDVAEFKKF